MLFNLSWKITLENYQLMLLEGVEITRSVEQLSDTATITLPGSVFNKALDIEKEIKRGNTVKIELGYNDDLITEFEGFIESIETNDGSITIKCEDAIYKLRKPVADKEFTNPDVSVILNYVLAQIGGYTLSCDYQFKYDKFTILSNTAYKVVKQIQEETKANVYLKGNVLHVHPQYKEIFGLAEYSFQQNIESSELEYRNADDRKTEVVVEGKSKDGKVIRETAGQKGGDTITIKIDGVSDPASLKNMAEEQLKVKSYTGYSGSFTGWLIPYCDAGYKVTISDDEYEFKDGTYYVLEVVTNFSKSGGSRQIKIGSKI
jgi:hypothetical protein